MSFKRIIGGVAAAGILALSLAAIPQQSQASSHREAPLISKDPTVDNTDLYAFVSPDKPDTVTIIVNYIPLQDPNGGPNFARSFVANTIIASNSSANCAGQPFVASGPNLQFGDSSCVDSGAPALVAGAGAAPQAAATVPSGDPKLGAAAPAGVAANGAPALNPLVFVMKPDSNHSAALNAGDNGICGSGPVLNFDATGVPTLRPYGDANCDLGAYEQ